MRRFTTVAVAGLASLVASVGTGLAADPPHHGPPPGYAPAPPGRLIGAEAVRVRPRWSYYGEYQYPTPFGYGFAYAPVVRPGFEYGYNGPRYSWSAPDWYDGPAFGYAEW